jgi:N-acetylmuramoyl-L-alanine amidase
VTDLDLIAAVRAMPSGTTYIVGLTLYGEGSGTGDAELHGIASAIGNRVKARRRAWGLTPDAVCLAPWQFSCWRDEGGHSNYQRVLDAARHLSRPTPIVGPSLRRCLALAADVVAGVLPDVVAGSTHYVTNALLATHPPAWARGKTPAVVIGSTAFFAGIA